MAQNQHNPLSDDEAAATLHSLLATTLSNLSRVLDLECNGQPL